jgi:hypothetical protein
VQRILAVCDVDACFELLEPERHAA